jgi:prepilin-type N-terminal cleavage/methylation domain-containing protein
MVLRSLIKTIKGGWVLMISLKRKQSGFTIVELLIVIVVIGILAALVVTTFSGIQKKARDSERQTDINAVHAQVEAYYAQKGYYPTNADLDDDTFVTGELKGLDLEALKDPKGTSNDVASAPAANVYSYAPLTSGDASCESDRTTCAKYTLTSTNEGTPATHVKKSLN